MSATPRSAAYANLRRPSLYLMLASLLLVVAAAVGLAGGEAPDSRLAPLVARGWEPSDRIECPGLEPGAFYEWSGEAGSGELFARPEGGFLVAPYPRPEPPYECRKIPSPHFIEEIQ